MDWGFLNGLQGCTHEQHRLIRRAINKPEFKLDLPGVGNLFSIKAAGSAYGYRCTGCNQDLPESRISYWDSIYNKQQNSTSTSSFKANTSANRKKVVKRTPIPAKLRYDILTRDNNRCVKCGARGPETKLHVDHKKPVALGGDNHPSNLQTLCEQCNLGKGARRG